MQRSVVIVKKSGHLIPDDLLSLLTDKYQSCAGVAIPIDGVLEISRLGEPTGPAEINELQQQYKDRDVILVLTHAGEDGKELVMQEDLQPFTILSKDDQPILVAFFDGNFEQFLQSDSTHSCESFAAEHVRKRLERVQKLARGDMNLIMEELVAEDYQSDLKTLMIGQRGSITFVAANGALHTVTLGSDKTHSKFPWGYVSNNEGYGVTPAEEPAPKPKGLLAGLGAAQGAKKSTSLRDKLSLPGQTPKVDTPPQKPGDVDNGGDTGGNGSENTPQPLTVPPGNIIPTDTGVHTVALPNGKVIKVAVNGGMKGKPEEFCLVPIPEGKNGKERKQFVKRLAEDVDTDKLKGFHQATHVRAKKSKIAGYHDRRVVKSLIELGPALEAKTQQTKTAPAPGQPPVTLPDKHRPNKEGPTEAQPAAAQHTPTPSDKKEQGYPERAKDTNPHQVIADGVPIVSPKQRAEINVMLGEKEIMAAVDRHNKIISDPTKFKEYEQEVASFQEQMGWKETDKARSWPMAVMLRVCKNQPEAAAVGWFTALFQIQKLEQELHAANELLEEASSSKLDTSGTGSVIKKEEKETQPMTTKQVRRRLFGDVKVA